MGPLFAFPIDRALTSPLCVEYPEYSILSYFVLQTIRSALTIRRY